MSRARNLADLLDANGDVASGALDNVDLSAKVDKTGDTMTGTLTFGSANNRNIFNTSGATTGYVYGALANSGGTCLLGLADSVGSFWNSGSSTANMATVGTTTATAFSIATNNTTRLNIDSAGRVTMPYQPSMLISGNQNGYAPLVTANGVPSTVPFNAVVSGNGTGFNASNHTFTAPVAGNYLISVWALSAGGITSSELRIYKNASRVTRSYNDGRGGYAMTMVLTLSANDYIQVLADADVYLNSTGSTYSGLSITLVS